MLATICCVGEIGVREWRRWLVLSVHHGVMFQDLQSCLHTLVTQVHRTLSFALRQNPPLAPDLRWQCDYVGKDVGAHQHTLRGSRRQWQDFVGSQPGVFLHEFLHVPQWCVNETNTPTPNDRTLTPIPGQNQPQFRTHLGYRWVVSVWKVNFAQQTGWLVWRSARDHDPAGIYLYMYFVAPTWWCRPFSTGVWVRSVVCLSLAPSPLLLRPSTIDRPAFSQIIGAEDATRLLVIHKKVSTFIYPSMHPSIPLSIHPSTHPSILPSSPPSLPVSLHRSTSIPLSYFIYNVLTIIYNI